MRRPVVFLFYSTRVFRRNISLDKCLKLATLSERVGDWATITVKVSIFGEFAIFNQFNDFGATDRVDFGSLGRFRRSLRNIDFSSFLTVE